MTHDTMGPIDEEALDTIKQLARTHRLVDQVYVAEEPITDSVRMIEPHHLFTRTMANVNQRIGQLWETESPKQ